MSLIPVSYQSLHPVRRSMRHGSDVRRPMSMWPAGRGGRVPPGEEQGAESPKPGGAESPEPEGAESPEPEDAESPELRSGRGERASDDGSSVPPLEPVPEVSGADQVAPQVPPPIEDLDPNAKSAATMVKPGPARLLPSCGTWWLSRQAAAITSPLPRQHRAVADTDSFCTWSSTSSSRRRSSGAEAPCGCARRSGSAPCRRAIGSARSSWCDAALLDSDSAEPIRPTPRVAWACAKDAIHNIDDESTMDGESRHESTPHSVDEHAEEGASGFGASEGIPASIMMAGMILVLLL
mmetsp:Transcript_51485/g.148587  ORF Transcript_51485/g.148587 Transcript_51485/m.148587 type:complete len:294 (-) Transcript_51485:110-991(-)